MKRIFLLLPVMAHAACPAPSITKPAGASVTVSWVAPTTYTDGTPLTGAITYNLYLMNQSTTTPYVTGITSTSSLRSGLSAGTKCYAVTAVVNGVESAQSESVAVMVTAAPSPPTGLTVK